MKINFNHDDIGYDVWVAVCFLFKKKRDSVNKYCKREGLKYPNVRRGFLGGRNGPKTKEMRKMVIKAAQQTI